MFGSRRDAFAMMHPLCNFIYLLIEIGIIVCSSHPLIKVIGLFGGFLYCSYQVRLQAIKTLLWSIPFALLVAIMNPLFSHQGVTILMYLPSGNALTLESIYYGLYLGLFVLSTLIWFSVWSRVMDTDKWIHLFGKVSPNVALLFSMVLGFIPKFQHQYKELRYRKDVKSPFQKFSMLMTWGLENSVDTADSMAARGYGINRKRRYFVLQKIRSAEIIWCILFVLLGGCITVVLTMGVATYLFYPMLQSSGDKKWSLFVFVLFGIYSALPLLICLKEDWKWRSIQKKIVRSNLR